MSSVESSIEALDMYTGTDYEDSTFDVTGLTPGEAAWETANDRELVCIGVTLGGDQPDEVPDTTDSIAAG